MTHRADYPCDEALSDLEIFFNKHIKYPSDLVRFKSYMDECKRARRIGFRFIHSELMRYRKERSDYFIFDPDEKKMIEDLLYFWA